LSKECTLHQSPAAAAAIDRDVEKSNVVMHDRYLSAAAAAAAG
jgi:hypothetical protein